jgi:hypothetical protein
MNTIDYNGHQFKIIKGEYSYNGLTITLINGLSPADFFSKFKGSKIMIQDMIAMENGKKRHIKIEKVESVDGLEPEPSQNPAINRLNSVHVGVADKILSQNPTENDDNDSTHYSVDKIISFSDWKDYCEYRRDTHQMASKLYQEKNRYFVIPSILLASVSGTLSFFATSDSINNSDGQKINLVVGTLAGISGLIQSFAAAFKFSAKAEAHQIAMESFDILLNKIRFKIARGSEGEEKDKDFLDMIEKEIIEIKHRCKTLVPDVVEKEYINRNYRYIRNKELFGLKKAYIEKTSKELRETLDKTSISTFENTLEKGFNAV